MYFLGGNYDMDITKKRFRTLIRRDLLWKRKFEYPKKRHGMLLLTLLGYVVSIALFFYSIILLDATGCFWASCC